MNPSERPSLDKWLSEAKSSPQASECGMFLFHNGTVRGTARAAVRSGKDNTLPVTAMDFDYDEGKTEAAISRAKAMDGIRYVRVWLNRGRLSVGDDIMLVLIGGDIRPHVTACLDELVGELKNNCVTETEIY